MADAESLAAAWQDPEIRRWTAVPEASSIEDAERWIGGAALREQRLLAVDRVIDVDDEVAGEVGLSSFDVRRGAALLGYWIAASHRGAGLGAAAVAAFCDWAVEELSLQAVVAEVDAGNPASIGVVRGAGFVELRGGPAPVYVRRS